MQKSAWDRKISPCFAHMKGGLDSGGDEVWYKEHKDGECGLVIWV